MTVYKLNELCDVVIPIVHVKVKTNEEKLLKLRKFKIRRDDGRLTTLYDYLDDPFTTVLIVRKISSKDYLVITVFEEERIHELDTDEEYQYEFEHTGSFEDDVSDPIFVEVIPHLIVYLMTPEDDQDDKS